MSSEVLENIVMSARDQTRDGKRKMNHLLENLQSGKLLCPYCREHEILKFICSNPKCQDRGEKHPEKNDKNYEVKLKRYKEYIKKYKENVKKYNELLQNYIYPRYRCPKCSQRLFSNTDLTFHRKFTDQRFPTRHFTKKQLFCRKCFEVYNLRDIQEEQTDKFEIKE